ncbi:MAG: type II toxin-antitoxin system VapC family toxin [Tepidiformaceae bacterium]
MTEVVVDASIATKWFLAEVHSDTACRLREPRFELFAPAFIQLELTSIATQKVRRGVLTDQQSKEFLERALALPLALVDDAPHLADAYRLALTFHPSVYDCLYAAVAISRACSLVTADRPFYDRLARPYPGLMLWVEDIPFA